MVTDEVKNLRRCKNNVGLEVELEDVRFNKINEKLWEVTEDGSLRGAYSYEFRFQEPLTGERALAAVDDLVTNVRLSNRSINSRTSLHIHVDIRNMNPRQLIEMYSWYSMFEYLFYNYYAKDRVKSNFAVPIHFQPWLHEKMFLSVFKNVDDMDRKLDSTTQRSWCIRAFTPNKYSALGLFRFRDLGTIEFRHFQVPKDFTVDSFRKCIDACLGLKSAAMKSDLSPWALNRKQIDQAGAFIFRDDWEKMKELDPGLTKTWLNYCHMIHVVEKAACLNSSMPYERIVPDDEEAQPEERVTLRGLTGLTDDHVREWYQEAIHTYSISS